MTELFRADGLSKSFPGILAVDSVSFEIGLGSIHALLGENGSGKSTLVKMIYGLMRPDSGRMQLIGMPHQPPDPRAARSSGVAMVFQHFSLFESMTVAENISLGLDDMPMPSGFAAAIGDIGKNYGLPVDPESIVGNLSAGERQRVEIIRCLLQHPKLLIMDEPTSVLTPQEAETLFGTLRRLASEGTGILYISHRLEEVRSLCEAATILRNGRVVDNCDPRLATASELAETMIGTRTSPPVRSRDAVDSRKLLEVRHVFHKRQAKFGVSLNNISFTVNGGEIFGLAGIAGNGQDELYAVLSGEAEAEGEILMDGHSVSGLGIAKRRALGLLAAPEERLGHAAVPDMDLCQNALLTAGARRSLMKYGLIDWPATRRFADDILSRFDVRASSTGNRADALSGGNLQKFVIGREILQSPLVLIVNQPTWGVDVAAAVTIRQALLDLAANGSAIIVISQDLDELFSLSDRLAVISRGQVTEPKSPSELTAAEISIMMAGEAMPVSSLTHDTA